MSLRIGVCLGSNADPSAICVVEIEEREIEVDHRPASAAELMKVLLEGNGNEPEEGHGLGLREPGLMRRRRPSPVPQEDENPTELHLKVRFLERFSPGTPMVDVAARLSGVVGNARGRNDDGLVVFLEVTGKGAPALDLFRDLVRGAYIVPVYLTFGDQRLQTRGEITLGKAALVTKLKILFEQERLHLSRGRESELLTKELMDYEVRLESDANNRPGAFKVGSRDELVTALGLAVHERHAVIRIR